MNILAIETSCDETAAAVVLDGSAALSNVISSQVQIHAPFGGVVPELASREHIKNILPIIAQALRDANLTLNQIDAFSVTQGPGLVGSLLVGLEMAKSLAYSLNKPLIPIHHIAAHLYAPFISNSNQNSPTPAYPYLGLAVSGGHTSLVIVRDSLHYEVIGSTLDDAAGEAFDKIAKLLELGYPGGPVIDRLAQLGNPSAIHFTRPLADADNFNFSFSGLKTAVLRYVKENDKQKILGNSNLLHDLVASFQETVIDSLLQKTARAAQRFKLRTVAICGGVACNKRLRQRARVTLRNLHLFFPPPVLCTDNAAMVAGLAYHFFKAKRFADLALNADANLPLNSPS